MFELNSFATILADPPWRYQDRGTRASPAYQGSQRAYRHYETLSIGEISAFLIDGVHVGQLARDRAHLWLWTTASFVEPAHQVCRDWGFKPATIFPWIKGRVVDGEFRPQIGMGHYVRQCAEYVLIGIRGKLPFARKFPGVIVAPRSKHSSKPEQLYRIIEAASPAPRLELFARTFRSGWTMCGDQLPSVLEVPNLSKAVACSTIESCRT